MSFQTTNGKLFYRVGDVIITVNNQNPAQWYGGTWELFAPGQTIVCIDTSQEEFNTIQKRGGNKYLQEHTHSATIANSGTHTHSGNITSNGEHNHEESKVHFRWKDNSNKNSFYKTTGGPIGTDNEHGLNSYTNRAGSHNHTLSISSGGTHNHTISLSNSGNGNTQNLQPYVVVYMWVRIA